MKTLKHHFFLYSLLFITILGSCKKDKIEDGSGTEPTSERQGIYVLSQGLFNANNSVLSYFDYDNRAFTFDQFSKVNSRGLGDTGNDAKVYGSKIYIVVNVSGTLEVVNARTGVSIKKIDVKNGNISRQPRSIVFDKNRAFISSFDGTVAVMDTTSLTIEKYITVGRNPEGMAIANGKLYVANSGGLGYPDNYDKTVSVIDLTTLTETKKITVVDNPGNVAADQYGDIYVLSVGNYTPAVPSSMAIIDSKTDVVKSQKIFSYGSMAISGDYAYITNGDGTVKLFNVKTELLEKENFISDGTIITQPFGIDIDDLSGEVFVTDAPTYNTKGKVLCFDKVGTLRYLLPAGINPCKVVFINK